MIPKHEIPEFVGQIIDAFEDFLAERNIVLPNDEIDDAVADGADADEVAVIYGTDYGQLQTAIEEILNQWSLT